MIVGVSLSSSSSSSGLMKLCSWITCGGINGRLHRPRIERDEIAVRSSRRIGKWLCSGRGSKSPDRKGGGGEGEGKDRRPAQTGLARARTYCRRSLVGLHWNHNESCVSEQLATLASFTRGTAKRAELSSLLLDASNSYNYYNYYDYYYYCCCCCY